MYPHMYPPPHILNKLTFEHVYQAQLLYMQGKWLGGNYFSKVLLCRDFQ